MRIKVLSLAILGCLGCGIGPQPEALSAAPMLSPSGSYVRRSAFKPLTNEELKIYPNARGMPVDVQRFIVRREDCEHWMGEEGYDASRKREINQAVRAICPGVDRELERLRARYRRNPRVLAALKDYYKVNFR